MLAALLLFAPLVAGRSGDEELLRAVRANDVERVRARLEEDAGGLTERSASGATPLHLAARFGALEVAEMLMAEGAPLDALDLKHRRPLHEVRDAALARLFLAHGEDARRREGDFESPFELAARERRRSVVAVYVDAGEPIGLADAAWLGMTDSVRALLETGADPDGAGAGAFNAISMSPLQAALCAGDREAARLLLDGGARASSAAAYSSAWDLGPLEPLVLAVRAGDLESVERLLERGAPLVQLAQFDTHSRVTSLLELAVAESPREIVRALCGHARDLDADIGCGLSALEEAAHRGRADVVDDLLRLGASIDGELEPGVTPLLVACASGELELARRLAARGARVDLFSAVALERVDLLESRLDADPGLVDARSPLVHCAPAVWAAALDRERSLQFLLARGASLAVDAAQSQTVESRAGEFGEEVVEFEGFDARGEQRFVVDEPSPLHAAAARGSLACIRLLASAGADLDAADPDGASALAKACANERDEAVRVLLELGADPDGAEGESLAPLEIACARARADAVRALLEAGADANPAPYQGGSAIDWVAKRAGRRQDEAESRQAELAARFLVQHGARPSFGAACALGLVDAARAMLGAEPSLAAAPVPANLIFSSRSPIEIAIDRGCVEIVALLADAGVRLGGELFPLHRAAGAGQGELVDWLIGRGCAVDARDAQGRTPLHAAALGVASSDRYPSCEHGVSQRALDSVGRLLAAGADLVARDAEGRTPLHLAAEAARVEAVERLLASGAPVDARDDEGRTPLELARPDPLRPREDDAARRAIGALLRAHGARD